jgi:hypothetical protein
MIATAQNATAPNATQRRSVLSVAASFQLEKTAKPNRPDLPCCAFVLIARLCGIVPAAPIGGCDPPEAAPNVATIAQQRRRESCARRVDQRRASPQSPLGARASGPARRGVVQARDRAETRCVLAQGDRQGHGTLPSGLLANSSRCEGAASTALGGVTQTHRRIKMLGRSGTVRERGRTSSE